MFLPGEMFFSAALEQDPSLIEFGVEQRVIPASPTTLIALLRAVAYGWQQEAMEENARKISELGTEPVRGGPHARRATSTRSARGCKSSLEAYNEAVGSLEGNVLVKARKFKELQAANGGEEIKPLEPIDRVPRMLQAPELTDGLPVPRSRKRKSSPCAHGERLVRRRPRARAPVRGRRGAGVGAVRLEYRPLLYRAADALDPHGGARDLADALYADLYGLPDAQGERQSLFRYYQGRSSLATWLRAVLSQRYVDRLREPETARAAAGGRGDSCHGTKAVTRSATPIGRGTSGTHRQALTRAVDALDRSRSSAARLLLCSGADARRDRAAAEGARGNRFTSARTDATGCCARTWNDSFATDHGFERGADRRVLRGGI